MAASAATWRARRHPLRRAGCATRPVLRESWRREPLTNERRAGRRQRHRDVKTHGWRSRSACKEWPSHAAAQRCNARTASACAANRDRFATGSHRWHLAGLCLQALVQVAWAVPATPSTAGTKRQHLKQKKKTESLEAAARRRTNASAPKNARSSLHSRPPCQHGLELLIGDDVGSQGHCESSSAAIVNHANEASHGAPILLLEVVLCSCAVRERARSERAAADRRCNTGTQADAKSCSRCRGWRPSRR